MTNPDISIITPENISAWVIKNRFRKGNRSIMSDAEMYNLLKDMLNLLSGKGTKLETAFVISLLSDNSKIL